MVAMRPFMKWTIMSRTPDQLTWYDLSCMIVILANFIVWMMIGECWLVIWLVSVENVVHLDTYTKIPIVYDKSYRVVGLNVFFRVHKYFSASFPLKIVIRHVTIEHIFAWRQWCAY